MLMAERAYTIGRVSKLTGIPVRRIRFYADEGLLPGLDRTDSGYRLFDEGDLVRLGLIKALRDAGLGLDAVKGVLARRHSMRDVLSLRLMEIEAHLESQRRVAAAIRVALRSPEPTPEDMRRIWMTTNASQAQYATVIEGFLDRVVAGAAVDPKWKGWMMRMSRPDLADEPTAAQLDAWIELSGLLAEPGFLEKMRRNAEDSAVDLNTDLFQQVQASIIARARDAMARGLEPDSPEGRAVADEYLSGWIRATGGEPGPGERARLRRKLLEHKPNLERYWKLVQTLNGMPGRGEPAPEWFWIDRAAKLRLDEE